MTAFGLLFLRNLMAVVMLSGIYSLLSAALFVVLDAVDVAFTEAAVGAGIASVLFIAALQRVGAHSRKPAHLPWIPLTVVTITGAALIYGTLDMPLVGDADNPVHTHVAPRYIQDSPSEVGVPNLVTAVLASYRGYDTLGETVVVFTAGVAVMLLLGGRNGRDDP